MKRFFCTVLCVFTVLSFAGCDKIGGSKTESVNTESEKAYAGLLEKWAEFTKKDFYISFTLSVDADGETTSRNIFGSGRDKDTAFSMYSDGVCMQHVFSSEGDLYFSQNGENYTREAFDYSERASVFESSTGGVFARQQNLEKSGSDEFGKYEKYSYDEKTVITYWFNDNECARIEVIYADGDYVQKSVYSDIKLQSSAENSLFSIPDGAVVTAK